MKTNGNSFRTKAGKIYVITVFCLARFLTQQKKQLLYRVAILFHDVLRSYPRILRSHPLRPITTYDDRNFSCNSINVSAGQLLLYNGRVKLKAQSHKSSDPGRIICRTTFFFAIRLPSFPSTIWYTKQTFIADHCPPPTHGTDTRAVNGRTPFKANH